MVSPVLSAKRESIGRSNGRKKNPTNCKLHKTTSTSTASVQFIHFQLQLTTALLGITLVLNKLISLASNHGIRVSAIIRTPTIAPACQQSERRPWRTPTMSATAARINEYVSIHLFIFHLFLLLQLQLQSNACLFVCLFCSTVL